MSFVTAPSGTEPHNFKIPDTPPNISSIAWGSSLDLLACGSWDSVVCLYEVRKIPHTNQKPDVFPLKKYNHNAPVLSVCIDNQNRLWSGGADGEIKVWQQQLPDAQKIGEHSAGVKCTGYVDFMNVGVTAGWDKCLKYWDLRQNGPLASIPLIERAYSMSICDNLLCVALANKKIVFFDLRNLQLPFKTLESMLKYQTRCVAMFLKGSDAFAVSSIEGRASIQFLTEDIAIGRKNFAFKCHRETVGGVTNIYSVNSLAVHPEFGTFSTAGSDGCFHFWDRIGKQRLVQFYRAHPTLPIVDTKFNRDGTMFAYACAYDWSKGYENATNDAVLCLHFPSIQEVKPKK
jgi:mRNA export factor